MARIRIAGLALLVLLGVSSLMAMPDHETEFDYYTDATKTVECGYKFVTCHGIIRSGCQTQWYDFYDLGDC
jgi:hypothetical protein